MQGIISSWLHDTGASLTVIPLSEFCKILPDKQPEKNDLCMASTSPSANRPEGNFWIMDLSLRLPTQVY
jgi:hypothetical protein